MEGEKQHKAGFVNILGNPNVGKSTLMNALVGEKLSIITSKAQTTRNRILGIVNGEDFQLIFSDTPGILKPGYKLQETMRKTALSVFQDADVLVFVTDVFEKAEPDEQVLKRIKKLKIPLILVLNKIDLADQQKIEILREAWLELFPNAIFIPVSALENFNLKNLLNLIIEQLPSALPFYPKDMLTDKSERFFAAEMIREKILLNYKQEVPYAVEVEIEEFKEEKHITRIRAVIYVERDSQKGIIIGEKGNALKRTGTQARLEMEKFFETKIFLELYVKVRKDWRDNDQALKSFGYH